MINSGNKYSYLIYKRKKISPNISLSSKLHHRRKKLFNPHRHIFLTYNTYSTSRFWLLFNNIFFDGNQVRHLLIHLSNSKFLNFFVLKKKFPRVINPKMSEMFPSKFTYSVNIEIILTKQTIYRIVLKLKFFSRKIKVTEATV